MELISKILPIITPILAILWILNTLGLDKKLKKLFKTEEKPPNHKQELEKIRAEINKSKTKEEKWPI